MGATAVGRVARANALDASAFGVGAQAGALSTALGSNSQAIGFNAVAIGAGAQAVDLSTALGTNAQALAPDAVALGQGSVANQPGTVSVGDAGSGVFRRIVDVAPAAGGTDAVNLSQLLSFITGNNSFRLPPPSATGAGSTAIAAGSVASGDYAVALGQASTASGNSSTALGRSAEASGDFSTAIGQGARALATNSVAIGSGTVADQPNTVSVGGRRLTDLAPGISSGDAATVGQVNRTGSRLSGGIAAAAALGGAVVPDQGRTFVGAGGATYNGQGGLAFGLVHHLDGSGLVLSGGVAFGTSGSQPIGRVAVGWLF
jgi:autotransporter adhesin